MYYCKFKGLTDCLTGCGWSEASGHEALRATMPSRGQAYREGTCWKTSKPLLGTKPIDMLNIQNLHLSFPIRSWLKAWGGSWWMDPQATTSLMEPSRWPHGSKIKQDKLSNNWHFSIPHIQWLKRSVKDGEIVIAKPGSTSGHRKHVHEIFQRSAKSAIRFWTLEVRELFSWRASTRSSVPRVWATWSFVGSQRRHLTGSKAAIASTSHLTFKYLSEIAIFDWPNWPNVLFGGFTFMRLLVYCASCAIMNLDDFTKTLPCLAGLRPNYNEGSKWPWLWMCPCWGHSGEIMPSVTDRLVNLDKELSFNFGTESCWLQYVSHL